MLDRAQIDSAADIAARSLFDAIIERRIPPGAPLRLKELADQLGTSMMPVREAIRRLAALDLVEIEPRKGARVRELSMADLEDTYFARLHLENIAVWEAAKHFSSEHAAAAAAALAEQEAAQVAGDRVASRDAHERFHFVIYDASRKEWLVRGILPAWRNAERYRVEAMRHVETHAQRNQEHTEILSALIRHDGLEAVRWMTNHLTTSVEVAAEALAAETGQVRAPIRVPKVAEVLSRLDVGVSLA